MSAPQIITFGCRLNIYESEVLRETLADRREELVVIHSCAVTNEAVRQARQAIRRARKTNPTAKIVVTGCAAQTEPKTFAAMPEVDRILGNADKFNAGAYDFSQADESRLRVNDIMAVKHNAGHMLKAFSEHARAFVEVQNGCDHRCTFCIIPYGRGRSRSVPAGSIVEQIKQLVAKGYREVVLTGVDLTSYGADLPGKPTLGDLVTRILKLVPDLPRLRLSSIDSIEVDEKLFEAMATEPRLMPHVHLSLQAGDDMILKRMKRRHNRAQAIKFCTTLRDARPEIVFGADIIAGFPTETEAMFQESLKLVEECGLTFLHVFPFSARQGTPAAKMPQIPHDIRKARAAMLRELGEEKRQQYFQSRVGQNDALLVERNQDGMAFGHGKTFAPIRLAGKTPPPGSILAVRVTGAGPDHLLAEAA